MSRHRSIVSVAYFDFSVFLFVFLGAATLPRRYQFDAKFLQNVSAKICNEVKNVNRVVYDITSKPPSTVEWE